MNEKLQELKALNEKFYELYGRLHENEELLGDLNQVKLFRANLFEQYKAEYNVLKIKFETIEKPALYEAEVRHATLVPRKRFFLFRNRARKLIDNEIDCELGKYFAEREKALERQEAAFERLIEALDKADDATQRTTAFDEPLAEQDKPAEPGADKSAEVSEEPKTDSKNAESVPPSVTKESAKQPVKGDDVAPIATTEHGKAKPKEQLRGQMTIDDVQTPGEKDKPAGGKCLH